MSIPSAPKTHPFPLIIKGIPIKQSVLRKKNKKTRETLGGLAFSFVVPETSFSGTKQSSWSAHGMRLELGRSGKALA